MRHIVTRSSTTATVISPDRKGRYYISQVYEGDRSVGGTMCLLEDDFLPGELDVICARGRTVYNHVGNKRFRGILKEYLEEYSKAESKQSKSVIVTAIFKRVSDANPDGGFVRNKQGRWYRVKEHVAREKIGQGFRDLLHHRYRSSTKSKVKRRRERRVEQRRIEYSQTGDDDGEHHQTSIEPIPLNISNESTEPVPVLYDGPVSFPRIDSFPSPAPAIPVEGNLDEECLPAPPRQYPYSPGKSGSSTSYSSRGTPTSFRGRRKVPNSPRPTSGRLDTPSSPPRYHTHWEHAAPHPYYPPRDFYPPPPYYHHHHHIHHREEAESSHHAPPERPRSLPAFPYDAVSPNRPPRSYSPPPAYPPVATRGPSPPRYRYPSPYSPAAYYTPPYHHHWQHHPYSPVAPHEYRAGVVSAHSERGEEDWWKYDPNWERGQQQSQRAAQQPPPRPSELDIPAIDHARPLDDSDTDAKKTKEEDETPSREMDPPTSTAV